MSNMNKRVHQWVGLVGLVALGACGSSHVLTQGEIGRSGARQFAAPSDKVFAVCVGALTAEGYEVASADPATGVIVTRPKPARSSEVATARAYRLTVSSSQDGQARVVAQPILYAGDRDISNAEVWTLAGPNGERAQWSELFGLIDSALAGPVLEPGSPEVMARTEPAAAAGPEKVAVTPSAAKASADKVGPLAPGGASNGLTPAGLHPRPTPSAEHAEPASSDGQK